MMNASARPEYLILEPGPRKHTKVVRSVSKNDDIIPRFAFQHVFCEDRTDLFIREGISTIEKGAFSKGRSLGNVHCPNSLQVIQKDSFAGCMLHMQSIELPPHPISFGNTVFSGCIKLRNVAIHKGSRLGRGVFKGCHNLEKIFSSSEEMVSALTDRFEKLPLHQLCYSHSFSSLKETIQQMEQAMISCTEVATSQQDCLGMTPLHILSHSTVQHISLYELLLQRDPSGLVVPDKWGSLPIHYALENRAPPEIIRYLLRVHRRLNQPVDYRYFLLVHGADFFETTTMETVQIILESETIEEIDWSLWIHSSNCSASIGIFRDVVMRSLQTRLDNLESNQWKEEIVEKIKNIPKDCLQMAPWSSTPYSQYQPLSTTILSSGIEPVDQIVSKLSLYEKKTVSHLLELAAWKLKVDTETTSGNMPAEEESLRQNCLVHCGSDCIISNVLASSF
ncbi:unnamed protein product [Cylindrotheca closterium]|uniref:Uncharacterized protein n=1 Tax=Cylindrotheca closterium TaxID=2856 RepID=A0AAD2CNG0_9STRA|nr:unnamed protein product [Cylindrotheca closterium]